MYVKDACELRKRFLIHLLTSTKISMPATYLKFYEIILDVALASQKQKYELL